MAVRSSVCALLGLWLLASRAAAQTSAAPPEIEAAESEEEREPPNELALVLGGTRERAENETSFTIGAEYERILTRHLGLVLEFEYVNGPDSWVFAAPVVFRPGGGWKLFIGPGLERRLEEVQEEHPAAGSHESEETRESLFLWRMGAGYGWEISNRYSVGPSFYVDAVREDAEWKGAFVFAFSLGVVF